MASFYAKTCHQHHEERLYISSDLNSITQSKNISKYYQLKTMLIEAQEEKEDDAKPILVRNELRLAACEPLE